MIAVTNTEPIALSMVEGCNRLAGNRARDT